MATNDFPNECSVNFDQKWLCVLLVDVSASMSDETLFRVNEEICNFLKFIEKDEIAFSRLELSVLTFGQGIKILLEPAAVNSSAMPQIVRSSDVFHAVDYAVEKIKARKRWYKDTGQIFYRPCLFLVTNNADEKLLHCNELKHLKVDVQNREFDFLMVGMNGFSVHANSYGIKIRMKDDRSLAQMLFSMWRIIKWGDDACEMPLSDGPLTGLIEPPLEGWVDSFEI